jgi:hypothetical protein
MSREKLKNIRNFINSVVRTYNYALKALDLHASCLKLKTGSLLQIPAAPLREKGGGHINRKAPAAC